MKVKVSNTEINLTGEYRQMTSMADDPENSVVFGYQLDESDCMLFLFPSDEYMKPSDRDEIIREIHSSLGENQGLIEVKRGKTFSGREFIYSIVKTVGEDKRAQYCLTLDCDAGGEIITAQGFYSESGNIGEREGVILAELLNSGEVNPDDVNTWASDPYDADYDRGALMTRAENEKFDRRFPNHPLTKAREFIKFFATMN